MRVLDLFCGAGGAGAGYARAGYTVVGVDLNPKPLRHNPHESHCADALEVLRTLLDGQSWAGYCVEDFALIHASPPCQADSQTLTLWTRGHVSHIKETRDLLRASGRAWILENVPRAPMEQGILICGTALGLNVRRHRLFDSSHLLYGPGPCRHARSNINLYGHGAWTYEARSAEHAHWKRKNEQQSPTPFHCAAEAFEVDWMTIHELAQAIPPAYTEYLARQLQ